MQANEIKQLLPGIYQHVCAPQSPLAALLDVMTALHAPAEEKLADFDTFLDPLRAPDPLVPYLARWVELSELFEHDSMPAAGLRTLSTGNDRLRVLIASAVQLARWRGTALGLTQFLQAASGVSGFVIEENPPIVPVPGQTRPSEERRFHIRVRCPPAVIAHEELIRRIVQREKPAYVTHEITYDAPPSAEGEPPADL